VNFDRIARHYHWLETVTFGNQLQRARVAFLDQIGSPKRALIAGEGNGHFLDELLRVFPSVELDCVDASARMLELARDRAGKNQAHLRFLHEDLLTWSPEENGYDLIVTHFFLDCFEESEVETIVDKLARSATQSAVWLLADFSVPSTSLARLHARAWLWSMHHFFRMVAGISARHLTNPSAFLEAHRFRCAERRNSRFGLVKSELWQRADFR
jgi:ubiquinone/menaquinone biosynthesis C-methylase UbiE